MTSSKTLQSTLESIKMPGTNGRINALDLAVELARRNGQAQREQVYRDLADTLRGHDISPRDAERAADAWIATQ